MVLPGLRGLSKRVGHGEEDVNEGRGHWGDGKYLFAC